MPVKRGSSSRGLVRFAAVILALALAAWLFSSQILFAIGSLLVNAGPPVKADAVVVIGGDWKGNRILKGSELVREGYAPRLFASGSGGMYGYLEADLAIQYAVSKGYPRQTMTALPYPALSTLDEARADIRELRARGIHRYILVTSDFHTARAGRIFRHEGPDLDLHVVAAPDPDWNGGSWWMSREGRKLLFFEFTKTVAEFFGL
jgi:uncharacterized SAM-binding protein YcdF (DUF218 family)